MFLSTRDPEEAWGNVRECTEAAHRLAEVVGGLRSRVPARAEESGTGSRGGQLTVELRRALLIAATD